MFKERSNDIMKCCIVGCENEALMRNEDEEFLCCCADHIDGIREYFAEQYRIYQQELYDDWLSSQ